MLVSPAQDIVVAIAKKLADIVREKIDAGVLPLDSPVKTLGWYRKR
jgi:hypothetical protein